MLIIGGGDGATPRKVTRHKNFSQSRWWKSMRVSLFCRHMYLTITPVATTIAPKLVIDDGVNFVNQTSRDLSCHHLHCTHPIGPGAKAFSLRHFMKLQTSPKSCLSSSHKTASAFYSRKKPSTAIAN
ncbi:hypothetical protein ACNKHP_18525 [Shigella boydii]